MNYLEKLKFKILKGYNCNESDILYILKCSLNSLCKNANDIRKFFCEDNFEICTIVNGKNGNCSENCKFCAQSSYSKSHINKYPLLSYSEILNYANYNFNEGSMHFSVVTSGKVLNSKDFTTMLQNYNLINKKCSISLCASHGLLSFEQLKKLKESGVTRYHNNIETSKNYFPNICTTHTYNEKIKVIKNASKAGLYICSGVILGLGETFEDRINMAFELKNLGVKSIPINILNPIEGTPFENYKSLNYEDILRTIAIFRFVIPNAFIRLAGGRSLLSDKGEKAFLSGANATISGDMLTTSGFNIKTDIKLVKSLGYKNIT